MKKMGMKKMIGSRKRGAPMPKAMATPKAMKPMAMEGQVPPMAGPMPQGMPGMKKGGAVKKSEIVGKGSSPAAAKADYKKKMSAAGFSIEGGRGGVAKKGLGTAAKGFAKGGMAKGAKGPGLGIMIILGKKKGK